MEGEGGGARGGEVAKRGRPKFEPRHKPRYHTRTQKERKLGFSVTEISHGPRWGPNPGITSDITYDKKGKEVSHTPSTVSNTAMFCLTALLLIIMLQLQRTQNSTSKGIHDWSINNAFAIVSRSRVPTHRTRAFDGIRPRDTNAGVNASLSSSLVTTRRRGRLLKKVSVKVPTSLRFVK